MSQPHGPPGIPHEVAVDQKRGQATMIWAVGSFCIFGWEWILCLPQEHTRIWKKKQTFISLLYLANRYFGLLQFSFVISLVANAWGPAACKHMFYWEPVGALISTVLSQMILGTRVYALYAQNMVIGIVLSGILIVEVAIGGYAISTTSPPAPIPGAPGAAPPCGAVMGPIGWLIAFWSIPLLYDTVTFLLTAWKAFDYWKKDVNTPLITVIWRDGVLYFFAIFSMNVVNVLIFLAAPQSLRAINLTPTLMLSVILSCRLVLNLRTTHADSSGRARSDPTKSPPTSATPMNIQNKRSSLEKATPVTPQSEWIDTVITSANHIEFEGSSPWPDPFPAGVGEHPTRMV